MFKKNDLRPLPKIKLLRGDPVTYAWMLDNIAPLIVGVNHFKSECKNKMPTQWLSTSSEAFAVLCLENYYQHVEDAANNKSNVRKPKWTAEGIRAKRNQGWKKEGIAKFDEYCKKVKEDRIKIGSEDVDTEYMMTKQDELTKDDERKRKRDETRREREDGWNSAYVDDWSGDETGRKDNATSQRQTGASSDEEEEDDDEIDYH